MSMCGPRREKTGPRHLPATGGDGGAAASELTLTAEYDTGILLFTRGNTPSANTSDGTTWDIGSLVPGETREISMTARILVRSVPSGFSVSIPLRAPARSAERDQNDVDNTSQIFISVSGAPAATDDPGSGDSGGDNGEGGDDSVGDGSGGGDNSGGDN